MEHLNSRLINKYIDNELNEAEITFVYNHLSECQTCQNEVSFTKKMVANLHKSQIYPSLDFSQTIMAKIQSTERIKSKIKNFFSFENNVIIFCVIFLASIFFINFLAEDNPTKTIKEPTIISNITGSILNFSSDIFSKASSFFTMIAEEKSYIFFMLGIFSFLFFLLVDQLISSHIRKTKKKLHGFK